MLWTIFLCGYYSLSYFYGLNCVVPLWYKTLCLPPMIHLGVTVRGISFPVASSLTGLS
jgi:hypothetical protein